MPETIYLTTQSQNLEDLNLQQHQCKNFKSYLTDLTNYLFQINVAKLLSSHRVPPQVADRGTLTRYGGYRGNKIPGVDQN